MVSPNGINGHTNGVNNMNGTKAKEVYVASNAYELPNFSIDDARPIKVVTIGAGYSDNKDWSAFYAPGPEIRAYLNRVVDKYALRPFIKLRHRITSAIYNEDTGKWHLKVRRPARGSPTEAGEHVLWNWKTDFEEFDDTADLVLAGLGGLSRWSWPDIPGFGSFKGQVIHSAEWDANESGWQETVKGWGNKRVAVIGVVSAINNQYWSANNPVN
ncbi:hypothetical protein C0989_004016 [Termitomyces sp. Mn162]|nr:hypothetical protein C0989_004016 [Termitomyces sp. Mn162]